MIPDPRITVVAIAPSFSDVNYYGTSICGKREAEKRCN
jgi:hypothetical protein